MTELRGDCDARVPLVIGAVGHRDLVDGEIAGLGDRVRDFLETLQRKYPQCLPKTRAELHSDGSTAIRAEEPSEQASGSAHPKHRPSRARPKGPDQFESIGGSPSHGFGQERS